MERHEVNRDNESEGGGYIHFAFLSDVVSHRHSQRLRATLMFSRRGDTTLHGGCPIHSGLQRLSLTHCNLATAADVAQLLSPCERGLEHSYSTYCRWQRHEGKAGRQRTHGFGSPSRSIPWVRISHSSAVGYPDVRDTRYVFSCP